MIYSDRRYFALSSMGIVLDSVNSEHQAQVMFMPVDGSIVYNPSTERIEFYAVDSHGCSVSSTRPLSQYELYLNLITNRTYEWNGSQMVEVDLSIVPNEEAVAGDITFLVPNATYHITSVITGFVAIGDGSTLVFHHGGRFVGCAFSGENIKVIPNGEQVIFENCNFDNCTFCDSSLCATNFGAVADMYQQLKSDFVCQDLPRMQIIERKGTDNLTQFHNIASFLSGSRYVKLRINGSFYIPTASMVTIVDARELEIYGELAEIGQQPPSKLIVGINLIDCIDVFIHDLSFVGFHQTHDFPTVLASDDFISNLRRYVINPNDAVGKIAYDEYNLWVQSLLANISLGLVNNKDLNFRPFASLEQFDDNIESILTNYTFRLKGVGVAESLGLANNGIYAKCVSGMLSCMHVWVDHCHFEMRQTCICGETNHARSLDLNEDLKEMYDVQGTNCTFSHIFYQPLASHCHGSFFENCTGDYVNQPIDWAECANHSRARNCHFTNCLTGPKQEYRPGRSEVSHWNSLEDCTFEISDPFGTLGMKHFIFQASQGAIGDTMIVRNCSFKVRKRHPYYGVFCRSWRTLFEGVSLQLGYAPDEVGDNSQLAELSNLFYRDGDSAPVEIPIIELDNFRLKAYTGVVYLFKYNIQVIIRDSEFFLAQLVHSCFEIVKEVIVNNSVFTFNGGALYFAAYTPIVIINNTTVNGGLVTYCLLHTIRTNVPYGEATETYNFTVRDSMFTNVGSFVYLNGNTNLHLSGNNIISNTFMYDALDDDYDVMVHVYGNWIHLRGLAFQNVSSRLFGDDFLLANNLFKSNTTQRVLADSIRAEFANYVYNNFFMGNVVPLNEGNDANRPMNPWIGMVYYNVNMGEYDIWNGQLWEHWSYPDED